MCEHDHHANDAYDDPNLDRGLAYDLDAWQTQQRTLRDRRAVLGLMGAGAAVAGGAVLLGTTGSAAAAVAEIPAETAGPYPGDGSNGPDVLLESGIVRRDIRSSIGSASGTAAGFPFKMVFTLVNAATEKPVSGLALYAWHCTRDGKYSMYSSGVEDQNYLRGVQVSNTKGKVRFTSIFPACYDGRWPHVHFEVYRNVSEATSSGTILATSQMALPRAECAAVYSSQSGYSASTTNLNRVSISSDGVFGDDDGVRQIATMRGSVAKGFYKAKLRVPVDL